MTITHDALDLTVQTCSIYVIFSGSYILAVDIYTRLDVSPNASRTEIAAMIIKIYVENHWINVMSVLVLSSDIVK